MRVPLHKPRLRRTILTLLALLAPLAVEAQDAVTRDRAEFTRWLETSPLSPAAAVAHRPIGDGVTLGPAGADLPVAGVAEHRLTRAGGAATLAGPDGRRSLARGRSVALGRRTILVGGPREAPWVTLFDSAAVRKTFPYYPLAPGLSFVGPLDPPGRGTAIRLLTLDGYEVEAAEAGSVRVPVGRDTVRLLVRRVPDPATGDSELEIYFQDGTSGDGSYPAGRFVTLDPLPGGRYRLDFNRSRNPFCAYSTAYPCPVPWPGNRIPDRIEAGERYTEPGPA